MTSLERVHAVVPAPGRDRVLARAARHAVLPVTRADAVVPTAALGALERYVDAFIPTQAADRMSRLVSVRMTKIKESIRAGPLAARSQHRVPR